MMKMRNTGGMIARRYFSGAPLQPTPLARKLKTIVGSTVVAGVAGTGTVYYVVNNNERIIPGIEKDIGEFLSPQVIDAFEYPSKSISSLQKHFNSSSNEPIAKPTDLPKVSKVKKEALSEKVEPKTPAPAPVKKAIEPVVTQVNSVLEDGMTEDDWDTVKATLVVLENKVHDESLFPVLNEIGSSEHDAENQSETKSETKSVESDEVPEGQDEAQFVTIIDTSTLESDVDNDGAESDDFETVDADDASGSEWMHEQDASTVAIVPVEDDKPTVEKIELNLKPPIDISSDLETILAEDLVMVDDVALRKRLVRLSLALQERTKVEAERLVTALNLQNQELHEGYQQQLNRLVVDKDLERKKELHEGKQKMLDSFREVMAKTHAEFVQEREMLSRDKAEALDFAQSRVSEHANQQIKQIVDSVELTTTSEFLASYYKQNILPLVTGSTKEETAVEPEPAPVVGFTNAIRELALKKLTFDLSEQKEVTQAESVIDPKWLQVEADIKAGNYSEVAQQLESGNFDSPEVKAFQSVITEQIKQRERLSSIFESWLKFQL